MKNPPKTHGNKNLLGASSGLVYRTPNIPPKTTPIKYAICPLKVLTSSWVLHKNARRMGANEALAIAYPFDQRFSSTIGIVNRLGVSMAAPAVLNFLKMCGKHFHSSCPHHSNPIRTSDSLNQPSCPGLN